MKQFLLSLLTVAFALMCIACTTMPMTAEQSPEPIQQTEQPAASEDEVQIAVTEWVVSSAEGMPDLGTLSNLTSLQLLDLTALTDVSYSEIESIKNLLPDCTVLWNVRLTDGLFHNSSNTLTLPNATEEDIRMLDAFPNLMSVDASGSTAYEALFAYQNAHPKINVNYTLQLGDTIVTKNDRAVSVPSGVDSSMLMTALQGFSELEEIDLRESGWSDQEVDAFIKTYPKIIVHRMITLGDMSVDAESEMLDLRTFTQWKPEEIAEKLAAFPSLKTVALPTEWTQEDVERISTLLPDLSVIGPIEVYGQTIDGASEEVDLSGTKLGTTDEVEALLLQMPFLKKLILCNCGLSNEQMESLCDAHPDIRFVWTIEIGKRKLRTDAIGFSTKNPSKYTHANATAEYNASVKKAVRLKEGDIELLRFCTDLEALDLGHNYLTNNDLVVISKLTKLKILILADNKITDISVLTTLKDLEYIELFMNKIPDLSPLCEMPHLQDINVCNTGVSDLTPLFSLTNAKRLWYAMNPFDREQAKQLKETLTDCLCNYTTHDETAEGWREDPRYQWMRAYFN